MKKDAFFILMLIMFNTSFGKENISKIKFVYGQEGVRFSIPVSCTPESFNLSFDEINFKNCRDSVFLNKFSLLVNKLKPDSLTDHIDARIMAIVTYDNKTQKDTLCFGEFHGIEMNGTFMYDNKELLSLVKKQVWPHCTRSCP